MRMERDESATVSDGRGRRVGGGGEGLGEDEVGDGWEDEEGELDGLRKGPQLAWQVGELSGAYHDVDGYGSNVPALGTFHTSLHELLSFLNRLGGDVLVVRLEELEEVESLV